MRMSGVRRRVNVLRLLLAKRRLTARRLSAAGKRRSPSIAQMRNRLGAFNAAAISSFCLLAASIGAPQAAAQPAGANAASIVPRLKPPAPAPKYISRNDLARVEVIRKNLASKRFADARRAADTIESPIAKSLALWYYFDAKDPLVRADDAKAFLDAHPDWPSLSKIQSHAEERMPSTLPAADVIGFFDQRDPESVEGKTALAGAFLATGAEEAATAIVSEAWRDDRFTLAEERDFLKRFGRLLSVEDHVARVDDLLFRRQVTNARRVFGYLPPADRRRAEARALLLLQAKGARSAYNRLDAADRLSPGVVHAAIRHYRRAGDEPRAISIARGYSAETPGAKGSASIWSERQLLMRYALKERLYADAYAMAAGHGLAPGGTSFSEAEFDAGWIALRFLDDPERAEVHFAALTASVTAPISLARGYYWLGRAQSAMGDAEAAAAWYEKASEYPYTYYGQLAAEAIGGDALARQFEAAPDPSPEDRARFASRPAAQALRILSEVGDQRAFLIFGYYLDDVLETPGEFLELAAAASRLPAPHVTVRAGKAGVRRGVFAPQVSYPTIYVPEEAANFVDPAVILGLSRQESEFNPRAYSRAGARGVMQLMPATAKLTANKERLVYRRSSLLDDPNYNMLIGSAHLSHLLSDLGGSLPMVFAGYNAGKGRVSQWIEAYGDPRTGAIDPIDWIELIPFSETRNYVQRVLENTQVYRSVLNGAPIAGRLAADIESGGASGRAGAKPAIRAAGLLPDAPAETVKIAAAFFADAEAEPQIDPPAIASEGAPSPATQAPVARARKMAFVTKDADAPADAGASAIRSPVDSADGPAPSPAPGGPADKIAPIVDPSTEPAPASEKLLMPATAKARAANAELLSARAETTDASVGIEPAVPDPAAPQNDAPADDAVIGAPSEDVAPQPTLSHLAPPAAAAGAPPSAAEPPKTSQTGPTVSASAVSPTFEANAPRGQDTGCFGYVAFIAAEAAEDAKPQDLNAGVLAELQSGGRDRACPRAVTASETGDEADR